MIRRRGKSFQVIVYAGHDPLTGKPLRLRESTTDEAEARRILRRLSAQIDEQRHAKTNASFRVAMEAWLRTHEIEETTRASYEQYARVAFFDATFSVQKSVTLIHTAFEAQEVAARNAGDEETAQAWAVFRQGVEDAIWAGNNAGLAYLAEHAGYSRVGHHGGAAGRYVDAHGLVVASFFQHDSRDHDPQLHIHNGILNRVEGPDGEWRTIDGRGLYRWRAGAAAVAERTTEERLTHALGMLIATRPDGKSREIFGVAQEAMDLISSRRRAVTAKAQELIDAYETRHGRAANSAERDRLSRQATFATRRAKSHEGETREQVLDRVDAQLRADVDGGLDAVASAALAARGQGQVPQEWSPQAVIETALADGGLDVTPVLGAPTPTTSGWGRGWCCRPPTWPST